jgi:hypothetical protein
MENSLDRLVNLMQDSTNPIELVELYIENYEKTLLNEFWGKKTDFQKIDSALDKSLENINLIKRFLTEKEFKNDPIVIGLTNRITSIVTELQRVHNNICVAHDGVACY